MFFFVFLLVFFCLSKADFIPSYFFLLLCRIEFVGAAVLNWRSAARVIFYRATSLRLGPGLVSFV